MGEHCRVQHDETGESISCAAHSLIGTAFRLHGRNPATGLDCVGLILCAAEQAGVILDAPAAYTLRTVRPETHLRWLDQPDLRRLENDVPDNDGDIWLVRPCSFQMHLMIRAASGFIHAHAGLRRIVFMPAPSPWPAWHRVRIIQFS